MLYSALYHRTFMTCIVDIRIITCVDQYCYRRYDLSLISLFSPHFVLGGRNRLRLFEFFFVSCVLCFRMNLLSPNFGHLYGGMSILWTCNLLVYCYMYTVWSSSNIVFCVICTVLCIYCALYVVVCELCTVGTVYWVLNYVQFTVHCAICIFSVFCTL